MRAAHAGVVALAAAVLAGCGGSGQPASLRDGVPSTRAAAPPATPAEPSAQPSRSGPPLAIADRSALAGRSFYVNPSGHAVATYTLLQAQREYAEAAPVAKIARQPTAVWFAGRTDPRKATSELTSAASGAGRTAVLVVYDIPQRDCGQHSAGGAADPAAYLRYVEELASGLRAPTVVVLEPDAIALALSGCPAIDAVQRYHLLGQAVDILLQRRPDTKVYIDAGNATWISDVSSLAGALQASGVERAAGFSLNVANYNRTSDTVAYGNELSTRLNGAHFIVDTSRNGSGPLTDGGERRWCNPPGRTLGTAPTADTGLPRVDAFLWIKQPGDSDGQCGAGQPPAGQWWQAGARALAR